MTSFSREMRIATRQPHALSDALANSKLVLALSDESVWIDALTVFYEIFKCIEDIKERIKMAKLDRLFVDERLLRASAFERDLKHYLGKDWKDSIVTRPEVLEYTDHIKSLVDSNPVLLLAYVYHLYMGLLSGGQIIRAKRKLKKISMFSFLPFMNPVESPVDWVFEFAELDIKNTKKEIKETIDEIAEELSEDDRLGLLDESKRVFAFNNIIIRTIKGTNRVLLRKVLGFVVIVNILIGVCFYFSS